MVTAWRYTLGRRPQDLGSASGLQGVGTQCRQRSAGGGGGAPPPRRGWSNLRQGNCIDHGGMLPCAGSARTAPACRLQAAPGLGHRGPCRWAFQGHCRCRSGLPSAAGHCKHQGEERGGGNGRHGSHLQALCRGFCCLPRHKSAGLAHREAATGQSAQPGRSGSQRASGSEPGDCSSGLPVPERFLARAAVPHEATAAPPLGQQNWRLNGEAPGAALGPCSAWAGSVRLGCGRLQLPRAPGAAAAPPPPTAAAGRQRFRGGMPSVHAFHCMGSAGPNCNPANLKPAAAGAAGGLQLLAGLDHQHALMGGPTNPCSPPACPAGCSRVCCCPPTSSACCPC